LVSLRPGWEARALLAVLAESTGLPATGWLRIGPDRFAPMGRALGRGSPRDSAAVGAAARGAALLVVQGLDDSSDAWSRSLASHAPSVIHWPADAVGASVAGVEALAPQGGEWYAVPDLGPSPVAAELAGASLRGLPPLSWSLPIQGAPPGAVPLEVRPGGTGAPRPALVLEAAPGRRRAVVLASGFWRWAARDGAPRDAYRRLWSGTAGWLLADDPAGAVTEVRPELWVSPAGRPLRWRIPAGGPDSVRLELRGDGGAPALDSVVHAAPGAVTPPLPAGSYTYRAVWEGEPLGEGRFDVEARSEEMLPRAAVPDLPAFSPAGRQGDAGAGAPLRRTPWPYLLVLLLLSAEWVGRRRAGLR
jgi:hypothetical protein